MNTLAKSKAQALVQPPKPLAVTPNVRQFNSPAAGAVLSLSNEATNIVQVVNPASTLTINVDGQNFSAFGANHLVLHVDTTAATEITLNFVRGATVLATKAIELEADQLAVLTFAAVIKANNAVTLLALGNHVVGKSEATDSNGAVGGLLLTPTGAIQSADGEYQRFVYDGIHATEVAPDSFFPNWYADLPTNIRQRDYQIQIKVPPLGVIQQFSLLIVDAENDIFMTDPAAANHLSLDFNGGDLTRIGLNIVGDPSNSMRPALDPQPLAGDVITLILTENSLGYVWSGGNGRIEIPPAFFVNAPNVLVYSAGATASHITDLSIKVSMPVDER